MGQAVPRTISVEAALVVLASYGKEQPRATASLVIDSMAMISTTSPSALARHDLGYLPGERSS